MSLQSARGGINGNVGVIGEDGGLDKSSNDDSSVDGMRTRQQRTRFRKKQNQERTEAHARTRQGAGGIATKTNDAAKATDDKAGHSGKKTIKTMQKPKN